LVRRARQNGLLCPAGQARRSPGAYTKCDPRHHDGYGDEALGGHARDAERGGAGERAHGQDAREEAGPLDSEDAHRRVPAEEAASRDDRAQIDERHQLGRTRCRQLGTAGDEAPAGEQRQREQARVRRHGERAEPLERRSGQQREGGLAGECPERQAQPEPGDAAVGPLDARRAQRHHDAGDEHPAAHGPALEQRRGEGQHHRHAADDHPDGCRVPSASG
jgi:hypothetical protein